jgi:hypothetical protein
MTSLLANIDALRIGSVDFVSPDEVKVLLDIEAPNDVALNAGNPRPFPRINGYALIPNENGFLVSQIEWITIERSQYPKRKGIQDFGIVDLPYPLRKMSLNPLGVLREMACVDNLGIRYEFSRGIESFPTVGDPVLLPTEYQLKSIIESGENRRVNIGVSPLAGNAQVSVDPDRLFGRHLAILGNTGSGKSCSVAGIIRWSVEAAQKSTETNANARFVILDPNGEYANAFKDMPCVRIYGVEKNDKLGIKQLKVPLWLWNSAEWCAFTQASSKAQRPTLVQALRTVRDGQIQIANSKSHSMRNYLRTIVAILCMEINAGSPWGRFPNPKNFCEKLSKWQTAFSTDDSFSELENAALTALSALISDLVNARSGAYPHYDFTKNEVDELLQLTKNAHQAFGGSLEDALPIDADIPIPFSGDDFLRSIEANAEMMGTTEYVETMLMRIRTLLSDAKLKAVISPDENMTLEQWLYDYICPDNSTDGCITVIDLSLMPVEIIHIITAVIARMSLESLQRYRKNNNGMTLPTTIVMEEAHTFIKRYNDDSENENASEMCAKVFEKIAREGRKFGLGLVLSSQRPSELSPTVLSQCNSFLLHRLSNDRDQELVSRLVPDNLRGLLRELPSLPSQNAILLGWASELPVMVRMNYLKEAYRPKSDDPDYWNSWKDENRKAEWKTVVEDWQARP